MTIIIIILGLVTIFEITNLSVYGKWITDKNYLKMVEASISKGVSINPYNPSIFSIGNMPYITKIVMPIFSYYHISDIGQIPRWTKMHKLLKKAYKEALIQKYTN